MKENNAVLSAAEIDNHLDAILRASGSALRNYSLPGHLEKMRAAVSAVAEDAAAKLRAPVDDGPVCQRCGGTGEADSGGIHPWGAPALIPCECTVSAPVADASLPPMPPTKDRGPSYFEGYTESDFDWNRNNPGALTWLADNHAAIRAALASAPVAGEAQPVACLRRQIDGSDWGHWKPGSVEDGQRVTGLRSWQVRWLVDAAPQASAEDNWKPAIRKFMDTAIPALAAIANVHTPDEIDALDAMPREPVIDQVRRLSQACEELSRQVRPERPKADKDGCTCPSGDGSLRHPCPMHPGADKDGGQQRAGDAVRDLIAKHAELLETSDYVYFELARTRQTGWMAWLCSHPAETHPDREVLARGQGVTPDEACRAAMADFDARAALSAPQAEQGERDA